MAIVPVTPKASWLAGMRAPEQQLLGLVCGTRGVAADFRLFDESYQRFAAEVPYPGGCEQVAVFVAPHAVASLPAGRGIIVLWAPPAPAETWSVLATLDAQRPSAIARTGWPTEASLTGAPFARIMCVIAPASEVANAAMGIAARQTQQLNVAQRVAAHRGYPRKNPPTAPNHPPTHPSS